MHRLSLASYHLAWRLTAVDLDVDDPRNLTGLFPEKLAAAEAWLSGPLSWSLAARTRPVWRQQRPISLQHSIYNQPVRSTSFCSACAVERALRLRGRTVPRAMVQAIFQE